MALPTGPIPLVAFDEVIEESWGDSVAQSLNNLNEREAHLLFKPTAEILGPTGGTLTQWFRVHPTDTITVPDWAHHVLVQTELNGVRDTGTTTYLLQVVVGPTAGRSIRHTGAGGHWGVSWTDYIACSSIEGDRSVKIYAARMSGSTRWAVDADSDIACYFAFRGAIQEYT